jgi:FecR protein
MVLAMMSHFKIVIATLLIVGAAPFPAATAQTIAGCTSRTVADPPRTVFECADGLIIEAEAAARIGLTPPEGGGAGSNMALDIDAGAAFLQVTPGKGGFQIRTPHAIASVRGTIYVVDVTGEKN